MRSFIFFLSLCLGIFSFSCGSEAAEDTASEETEQQQTQPTVDPEEVASTQPQKTEEGIIVTAVYKSVAVYTGRTEYEFITVAGDQLLASVSNFDENKEVEVPDNMLNENQSEEGPPGANPAMIDKTFKLYYDKDSKLVKIELAN